MVIAAWRRAFVCSLMVAPLMLLGSGCRTASGWRTPWSAWGGASSPSSTAVNISKPSTQAPAPSSIPGQPNRSVAASGGANPSGVTVGGGSANRAPGTNAVAGYPATSQAYDYPSAASSTWQPAATTDGQVAPAGGMQVGRFSMQSQQPSGYAGSTQPRGPAASAASYSGAPRGNAASGGPAAVGPYGNTEDYRTADNRGATGGQAGAASSGGVASESPEASSAGSVYGGSEGAATATEPSAYGSVDETSPAVGGNEPEAGTDSNPEAPAESASPRSYGPPNTVVPSARSATAPAASSETGRVTLPASLSSSGGYRPGSTGGYGTRNAGFDQPENAAAPENEPAGSPMYR